MPVKHRSYRELLTDWEGLLRVCKANQDGLPGVDLEPLEEALVQVTALKLFRRALNEMSKETTLSLHEVRDTGRVSARRMRSLVKAAALVSPGPG
jgi:hypothetical protein